MDILSSREGSGLVKSWFSADQYLESQNNIVESFNLAIFRKIAIFSDFHEEKCLKNWSKSIHRFATYPKMLNFEAFYEEKW